MSGGEVDHLIRIHHRLKLHLCRQDVPVDYHGVSARNNKTHTTENFINYKEMCYDQPLTRHRVIQQLRGVDYHRKA